MRATAEPFLGELREPTFDEVEPRAVRRREVQREAQVTEQPAVELGGLVRRGVVNDDVHVELGGHAAVDEIQEPSELDRAVLRGEIRDHVA